jgi:hypothetical protein
MSTLAITVAEWQFLGKAALLMALIGIASAICTPKDRLPLALRGLKKLLGKESGASSDSDAQPVPAWKKTIAFLLVLAAAALAIS